MNEAALIARARAGQIDAQRRLYEANVDRVFRLAFRMTGDEALAQDLTQDSFLRAFDRLDTFREESKFSTWLHTLATSVILNGLRKVKRLRERETELEPEIIEGATSPRDDVFLRRRLSIAIDDLSEKLRIVFVMVQMEGFQHQEVAEILDIPIGTSKARLNRAKVKLRESLADVAPELAREANGDMS